MKKISILIFVLSLATRCALVRLHLGDASEFLLVEPVRVAVSIADHGAYADAYGEGSGPTAHEAPLHPLLLALLIRLFGTGSAAALAINLSAVVAVSLGNTLLPSLSEACELGADPGAAAGLISGLLPLNYWYQTAGSFDAPFAFPALVALLLVSARQWKTPSDPGACKSGFVSGLSALLNPATLQVTASVVVLSAARTRENLLRALRHQAILVLCVVATLSPWAIFNYFHLGKAIFTRSNFWLEFQVSNNDAATPLLERNTSTPALKRMHPSQDLDQRNLVRALGEPAYMTLKQHEATQWVASHPGKFLWLTLQRAGLFWFPEMSRPWQSGYEAVITLAGFAGMVRMFRNRHPFASFLATSVVSYSLVYAVIQVSPRYRFPIEGLLLLCASSFLSKGSASGRAPLAASAASR